RAPRALGPCSYLQSGRVPPEPSPGESVPATSVLRASRVHDGTAPASDRTIRLDRGNAKNAAAPRTPMPASNANDSAYPPVASVSTPTINGPPTEPTVTITDDVPITMANAARPK